MQNFVALEEVFKIIAADYEMVDMYEANRKLLSALGSCFVQVVHKAQTIFQVNAKYEAELLHLREEHSESKATLAKLDSEKKYLVCRLQSALLDNHKLKQKASPRNNSSGSSPRSAAYEDDIQLKLANEMAVIQRVDWDAKKLEGKCNRLENENSRLRLNLVEMESELVGARLDSKYLDKELAGRIQQIQILLASGTSQEHKQKVWSQIESEMHLQRSKTISNMCYSKQKVKDRVHNMNSTDGNNRPRESSQNGSITRSLSTASNPESAEDASRKSSVNKNCVKQVMLHKNDTEELGMAILGGKEHGLPIMVSGSDLYIYRCMIFGLLPLRYPLLGKEEGELLALHFQNQNHFSDFGGLSGHSNRKVQQGLRGRHHFGRERRQFQRLRTRGGRTLLVRAPRHHQVFPREPR